MQDASRQPLSLGNVYDPGGIVPHLAILLQQLTVLDDLSSDMCGDPIQVA